mgnify:CR=1 FL=1
MNFFNGFSAKKNDRQADYLNHTGHFCLAYGQSQTRKITADSFCFLR